MKLQKLQIENYCGCRDADIRLPTAISAIFGRNGSAKSSIIEALRFALLAQVGRDIRLKGDYGMLISDGTRAARVGIVDGDGVETVVSIAPSGKVDDSAAGRSAHWALQYALNPQRLPSLPPDERRVVLMRLAGIAPDGEEVRRRLMKRGCEAQKVDAVVGLLARSFEAAAAAAEGKARECKAAWKQVTGETWGSQKSASWAAEKPEVDAAEHAKLKTDHFHLDEQIRANERQLGEWKEARRAHERRLARIEELRPLAARYAAVAEKLQVDRAELGRINGLLAQLPLEIGEMAAPLHTEPCPHCGQPIARDAAGRMIVPPAPRTSRTTAADEEKRTEYRKAKALVESSIDNDERDLMSADAAAKEMKLLEDAKDDPPVPDTLEIERLERDIGEAVARRNGMAQRIEAMNQDQHRLADANRRTGEARTAHLNVTRWLDIAAALGPEGLPAELSQEAVAGINDRMAQAAADSGWQPVMIGRDMAVTYGGRLYQLCSGSEQWRAAAMIAEAVAFLSGVKILALDEADILEPAERGALFDWLAVLAEQGEQDTVIVGCTVGKMPTSLPDGVTGFWVQDGRVKAAVQQKLI